jgi:O-antigen ligase
MYLARTNFLQFGILFLAMKGYFVFNKKSLKVLFLAITSLLIAYTAIFYANPKRNGEGLEGFMYKIKISPQEAFKTKINKNDWKDFNDNYRSFENIITIKQVALDGERAIFTGKGLGSTLNLGQKIYTTDGSIIQNISVAHNGFMTIYLKSGLLGVILLVAFLIMFYRQTKSNIYLANNVNMLLIGTCVFLIVSTWVFMGLYFKLDNKSIIIGFLMALKEKTIFEAKSINIAKE